MLILQSNSILCLKIFSRSYISHLLVAYTLCCHSVHAELHISLTHTSTLYLSNYLGWARSSGFQVLILNGTCKSLFDFLSKSLVSFLGSLTTSNFPFQAYDCSPFLFFLSLWSYAKQCQSKLKVENYIGSYGLSNININTCYSSLHNERMKQPLLFKDRKI